jgi:hypothetical protein
MIVVLFPLFYLHHIIVGGRWYVHRIEESAVETISLPPALSPLLSFPHPLSLLVNCWVVFTSSPSLSLSLFLALSPLLPHPPFFPPNLSLSLMVNFCVVFIYEWCRRQHPSIHQHMYHSTLICTKDHGFDCRCRHKQQFD